MDQLLNDIIFDVGFGSTVAILALGIVLTFRTTGVLNFSLAGTGTFGAYVMYSVGQGRSPYLAIAAGVAAAAGVGVASFLIVRSIHTRQQALTSAVATLAIAILLQQIIRIGWGSTSGTFPSPFGFGSFALGTISIDYVTVGQVATACLLGLGMSLFLLKTRNGTMLRAISDNPVSARLCGANLFFLLGGVWAFAAGLAAASAFFAAQVNPFEPSLMDLYFLSALIASVIGGLRSLLGAFFGAIVLQVAGDLFKVYGPSSLQNYEQTFLVLLLVAVLVFTPKRWLGQGLQRAV